MTSPVRLRVSLLLAALFGGAAAGLAQLPPEAAWRVLLDGADVTSSARPRITGGVLFVDIAALAPVLALTVRSERFQVTIGDAQGLLWSGSAGSSRLQRLNGETPLARPVQIEGSSVFLAASDVARLAGLTLSLKPQTGTAAFLRSRSVSAPAGWTSFTIPKPAGFPAASGEGEPAREPEILPPDHDKLRVGVSVGHVAGADSGGDLTATGSWSGIQTRAAGVWTQGPEGAALLSGFLGLQRPESWGVEAGDLFSEIWGHAQGIRWLGGERSLGSLKARGRLSLYSPDDHGGNERTVVTGGGELTVGSFTTLAAELASDGAWLARGNVRRGRFALFGFRRQAAEPATGLSGFAELPKGMVLQAGWSRGDGVTGVSWREGALRVPVTRYGEVSVEATGIASDRSRIRTAAVSTAATLGPVSLRARLQDRHSDSLIALGSWLSSAQRELSAGLSFAAGGRLRFDLFSLSRGGQGWQQLGVTWRPFRSSTIQALATSSGAPFKDPIHLRFEQGLANGYSLFLEYGRIAAFQGLDAGAGSSQRIKVSLRKVFDIATPPGGGSVEGNVLGVAGPVASGMPVELGPWRTSTDTAGRFAFHNVPSGQYAIAVPPRAVPAAYAPAPPQRVQVAPGRSRQVDLPLQQLGEVAGVVYVDRNGNGRKDQGEGVAAVVLWLDNRAVASDETGAFVVHEVAPGAHTLRIDPGRLPAGFALTAPSRLDLGLPAGGRVEEARLRLIEVKKSVVLREMKR